jgi:hypothetical protein
MWNEVHASVSAYNDEWGDVEDVSTTTSPSCAPAPPKRT